MNTTPTTITLHDGPAAGARFLVRAADELPETVQLAIPLDYPDDWLERQPTPALRGVVTAVHTYRRVATTTLYHWHREAAGCAGTASCTHNDRPGGR
ncbi:hypothetical protein [Kitasatospora purpeofusca]|uniref:hypothetical protein n=1 Tax=Kitasatospora purpeofusca TaxID=67352 RepID=UPI0036B87752